MQNVSKIIDGDLVNRGCVHPTRRRLEPLGIGVITCCNDLFYFMPLLD